MESLWLTHKARITNVIFKYAPITSFSFCTPVGHQWKHNINTWPQGSRLKHSEKGLINRQYSIHWIVWSKTHWRDCSSLNNSQCICQQCTVHRIDPCSVLDISRAWEPRTGVIYRVIDAGEVPIRVRWTQPKNSYL